MCARIDWNAFLSVLIVSVDAVAFIAWIEIVACREHGADTVDRAVVDWLAVVEAVAVVMLLANAVISHLHVDARCMDMTLCRARFTFIHGTNDRIVIAGQPLFPLGLVGGGTLRKDMVKQLFNSFKKILGTLDVVEVDEVARNCACVWGALCTVSVVVVSVEVRSGDAVFLLVDFAERKHLVQEYSELLLSIAALAELDS